MPWNKLITRAGRVGMPLTPALSRRERGGEVVILPVAWVNSWLARCIKRWNLRKERMSSAVPCNLCQSMMLLSFLVRA